MRVSCAGEMNVARRNAAMRLPHGRELMRGKGIAAAGDPLRGCACVMIRRYEAGAGRASCSGAILNCDPGRR